MRQHATIVRDDIFECNAIVAISGVAEGLIHGGCALPGGRLGVDIFIGSYGSQTNPLLLQILYRSVAHRNQMLQIGMPQGMNMAHNRLQHIVSKLK